MIECLFLEIVDTDTQVTKQDCWKIRKYVELQMNWAHQQK